MYVYYVLRGTQAENSVEMDGDVDAEQFPGIDLGDGPTVINALVAKLTEDGVVGAWQECDLTDSFFDLEDNYIYFNERWMRRSDAPLVKGAKRENK